jgi:hypothetical protein
VEKPSVLEAAAFVAAVKKIDLVMILEDSGLAPMEASAEADKRIGIAMERLPELQMHIREQYSHDERLDRNVRRPIVMRMMLLDALTPTVEDELLDIACRREHDSSEGL